MATQKKIHISPTRVFFWFFCSGTLSPLAMYPRILGFTPSTQQSFTMSLSRRCVQPVVLARGSDQQPVTSRFEARGDPGVLRNYGEALREVVAVAPDGVVAFFPSYRSVRLLKDDRQSMYHLCLVVCVCALMINPSTRGVSNHASLIPRALQP
jgi:Rad3-related DNA helicase